ncbi:DUF7312 domain-containing protein [Haloarchaeobius litoreus]|uniref:DUF7312 domain-containing protein n=1 Tax=Haloarchaeobius litoreus TaxID=755306 RepID=A0ABD6DQ69_9EURY|nr:hypothetical protein [Haloarchaeobius litoreus]
MEDESTRDGDDGTPEEPSPPGPSTDGPDATEDDLDATEDEPDAADGPDEFEWVDDGDWDPPTVERRASDDAQAVAVGYVDMDEVIEPGDVSLENAVFVAIGVLGTVGLVFYIVQLAG